MLRNLSGLAIFVLAALAVSGCASNLATKKRVDTELPAFSRVALLPFENLSGREKAGEKLTDYFVVAMTGKKRLETVEFGELYDNMRRFRIRSSSLLTGAQIDSLAAALNLDYILTGAALEYEEFDNTFLGKVPQVSFNCRLIDCRTGKTVWVANSNGRGDKGEFVFGIGVVKSSDNLARKMVQEAVDDLTNLFAKN